MRVAIVQTNPVAGDIRGNEEKILSWLRDNGGEADLAVFPEMAIAGYFPWDILERGEFIDAHEEAVRRVVGATAGTTCAVAFGVVERNQGPGRPLLNGVAVAAGGEVLGKVWKSLLPTYDVFDERRYFEPGPSGQAVTIDVMGERVGFLVCEDIWNDGGSGYGRNPVEEAVGQGARLLVAVNSSPSDIGKRERRHSKFGGMCSSRGVGLVYANQVGGQDEVVFDGRSFWMDGDGRVAGELAGFEEDWGVATWDGGCFKGGPGRGETLTRVEETRRQLCLALRDYARKTGFSKVLVGSSGGIDSALTLALAVEALGAENVEAVTMPGRWSSEGSVTDSERLCGNLGVRLWRHPMGDMAEAAGVGYEECFGSGPSGLAKENLQARIRGMILMERSNSEGSLLLSTGNKSEVAVGYATLYGDMCGGFNLIGDLYKMEVYALSRWLNERAGGGLIPEAILSKEPSAELAPGQKDSDALPPYPVLDAILKLYVERELLSDEERMESERLASTATVGEISDVLRRVEVAEYKRRQAAPVARVRGKAFGVGRRMPLARDTSWRRLPMIGNVG